MDYQFKLLRQSRQNLLRFTEQFTLEELNEVPEGFNNNIIWHMGHILVTQQLLCYKNAGVPCRISDEIINQFRKGTKPEALVPEEEVTFIRKRLTQTPSLLEEDFRNGLFGEYNEISTSFGNTISNIEEAVVFNNIHEGMHFGYLLALRRALTKTV
ncbi:DinB family protein [Limibacter armeniacum]|uniref:DinB family protein n=1 Tax=Limibacter armeniacum TaxID=466084 RepID=UPI002FE60B0D